MSLAVSLRNLSRPLVEYRVILSIGLSAACGIVLQSLYPVHDNDPLLRLLAFERPAIFHGLVWSYNLFLYSTPFLVSSVLCSLAYIHFYEPKPEEVAGQLPPYPDPLRREDLFLVAGEVHRQLKPLPSPNPNWLCISERGLYTGICVVGAIGSGKTQAVILPAMRQLFAYRAQDPEQRLSGVVLEVKGDLCRQVRKILTACSRPDDYVEVSLTGNIRYNPLNNDMDAYAQAFNIASVITAIWGKGKEPFWQQSYTDLVRYVIMLYRVRDGYVTMLDIFRTVISSGTLEAMLTQAGRRFTAASFVGVGKADYLRYESVLTPFGFVWNDTLSQYVARRGDGLESLLVRETNITASLYTRRQGDPDARDAWQSIHYWYWEHWKFFRTEVKTSIIQGIAVFLSLFETNAQVRRIFCPPKELYEGKPCPSDPTGVVLPPFDELIEDGHVVGLNFPTALNPALSKIIGTMMKVDYQRAVLLRIPIMEDEPERHFRPTVFICDEYQNFATVGGDNPNGDERFLSLSRQPKCIPIVATQSISSLKEALPNEGVKTLLQAFRTKIFLSTSDPDTARYASELCGKADKTRISYTVSESSNNANVGWLSGRTSSNKGSVSASKQYQKHKEPLFEENVFFDLKNTQSVVVAFDGISPLPPTYCYLKPDFLPVNMTWFEQERIAFNPRRISR
ncbi:type IV secretory system conjugative DNA transfer family protein [Paracidobacterium acidisoli]|uniref:TraD/TraG TraM recognition site domain-containing protein n=1 Tax=Paracidobacterium acidisoli TaxID=2303751 RepID=A0A372IN26_9BACT|nr:TraM recognition domain-containing protein [Paracidobacterium acidisoli]MBT9332025.1 TraM recognition domain-containing protein [Paracidobacterium acidisoli]